MILTSGSLWRQEPPGPWLLNPQPESLHSFGSEKLHNISLVSSHTLHLQTKGSLAHPYRPADRDPSIGEHLCWVVYRCWHRGRLCCAKQGKVKVAQSCLTLLDPTDCLWNSPSQNTGVGSLSLLQGIFPIQGSNPGLLHCKWILYQLSHKGSPRILEWVAYHFSRGYSQPRNRTGVSCIAGRFFADWATREDLQAWNRVHMSLSSVITVMQGGWQGTVLTREGLQWSGLETGSTSKEQAEELGSRATNTVPCGWWGRWSQVFPSYSGNGSGGWWGHTDLRLHCGGQRRDSQYILLPPFPHPFT